MLLALLSMTGRFFGISFYVEGVRYGAKEPHGLND